MPICRYYDCRKKKNHSNDEHFIDMRDIFRKCFIGIAMIYWHVVLIASLNQKKRIRWKCKLIYSRNFLCFFLLVSFVFRFIFFCKFFFSCQKYSNAFQTESWRRIHTVTFSQKKCSRTNLLSMNIFNKI